MRAVYVAPSLAPASGWRSLTVGAVTALARAGMEPTVVLSARDVAPATTLLPSCPTVVVPDTQFLAPGRLRGWPRLLAARRALQRITERPALVHSLEAYPTGLVGHWLAARLGCPHVLTAVGTYAVHWERTSLDGRWYARVLRQAAAVCPISQGTAALMRRHVDATPDDARVHVVPIGTDACQAVPRAEALDRSPVRPPLVLSVGAIKPRKGYEVSLRAFARVKARVPDARYRIVGRVDRPDYHARLRRLIAEEDIRDVEFRVDVTDAELDAEYRDAAIFLLTPERHGLAFEGFGLVYLEAGAYGLPVVATDSGGVADAVRHETTGLLAPEGDAEAVAAHLLALLEDPERAARLGRANREWAEHLSWDRYATEQVSVYERVAGESEPGR